MSNTNWYGWHFLKDDGTTGYGGLKPVVGETMTCEGRLQLCDNGLHASARALDAMYYAPGAMVQYVELIGERLDDADKSCARSRRCIAMADATNVLHEFACWCAECALVREREAGREPDARSWAAIETKRRWLRGEATNEELAAAKDAAYAAWSAAKDAAYAAWSAAYAAYAAYAAWAAAWSAAWAASATGAAWSAAKDAARDTEREAQNAELERMLRELLGLEGTQ